MTRRRMRGDDCIGQYKNGKKKGKFFALVWYRESGKRKSKRRDAASAVEARRLLKGLQEERDSGVLSTADRSTLSGFFAVWLKMPTKKGTLRADGTVYTYKQHFTNHIEPVLGTKKLDKITQADIIDLDLSLEHQPAIRQAVYRVLRAIFKTAVRLDMLAKSPLDKLPEPKHTARRWTPLTDAQQGTFVAAVASDWYEALWLTALDGGLREGELFGLRMEDYDLANLTVTVRRQVTEVGGKQKVVELLKSHHAYRTVELSATTIDAVKRHRERLMSSGLGKSGLMYPSVPRTDYAPGKLTIEQVREARSRTTSTRGFRQLAEEYGVAPSTMFLALQGKTYKETSKRNARFGGPLYKGTFIDRFNRICEAAGLPGLNPHYLRHTAATRWLQQGVPIEEVRRRLGHKDVETTLKFYAHVMPGYGRKAADGFDRLVLEAKRNAGTSIG